MATVRTTLYIDEALFNRAEEVAQEMQISRSQLYTLALESIIERYEKLKLANAPGSVSVEELTPAGLDLFAYHSPESWR